MKRILIVLLCVLALISAVMVFWKPAVISFAQKQIQKSLAAGHVSIRDCGFQPFQRIRFWDLEISSPRFCEVKIKEISAEFDPLGLLKRTIRRIAVKHVTADVDLMPENIAGFFSGTHKDSSQAFQIQELEISDVRFNLKLNGMSLKATAGGKFDLNKRSVMSLDLVLESFEGPNFSVRGGALRLNEKGPGLLTVETSNYQKLQVTQLNAEAALIDNTLRLDSLNFDFSGGKAQGFFRAALERPLKYSVRLSFTNLDLARLINDLDLKEKVRISGILGGTLDISGEDTALKILAGEFSTAGTGGFLAVQNTDFLKKLARDSNQPLDLIVESFKNYQYNNGHLGLALDQGNVVLNAAFDGEAGKRNLNVTLHDFLTQRKDP